VDWVSSDWPFAFSTWARGGKVDTAASLSPVARLGLMTDDPQSTTHWPPLEVSWNCPVYTHCCPGCARCTVALYSATAVLPCCRTDFMTKNAFVASMSL
jgi:hypothetical protein